MATLIVGMSGYATIQAAIDASTDGDIIAVDAGTYAENLSVNKAVTIQGANAGVAGSGSRGAETVIQGQATVTAAATIDGVKVLNTSANNVSFVGVNVQGDVDVTIANSVFYSTGPNGTNEDRAILLATAATGNVSITDNLFGGDSVDKYGTANWHRGVWSDGTTESLTITGNTFEHVRSDLNLDGYNDAVTTVSGNSFTASGTAISLGTPTGTTITGIHDNTFNDVDLDLNLQNLATGQTINLDATNNDGAGAGLAAVLTVTGSQAGDTLGGNTGADQLFGNGGNDSITGGAGDDYIDGGAGAADTAVYTGTLTAADFSFTGGAWHVAGGAEGNDTLTGIEVVTDGAGHTFRLVSTGAHIQTAIDAAGAGDAILVAPGTYTESGSDGVGHTVGLYINKSVSLYGYSSADGALVTDAQTAKDSGPTVIAGHQTGFGANHWIDAGGDNVLIQGLHLQAGPETNNKLLEIWGDNATVQHSFIDVNLGGVPSGYTFAAAVYINDNGTEASDDITAFTINNNILNEGIIVANGVGDGSAGVGAGLQIHDNVFEGHFDEVTGSGRYDTVVVNGQVNGVGWLLEPTQLPSISGNDFGDNSTPFILRGSEDDAGKIPTAAEVKDIVDNNGDENTQYAYVTTSGGDLRTADTGGTHKFVVTNTIDTLNLALDTTTYFDSGSTDQVFPEQRIYMQSGDTVHVQSGEAGPVNSQIMVDGLTVTASSHSSDLNLTLATEFADGSAIADGGVHDVTLGDYAAGLGADVDVTGNTLDNVIIGNSGANALVGAGGNDTFNGGGGNDDINGGFGKDTAVFSGPVTLTSNGVGGWTATSADGVDNLTSIEVIEDGTNHILLVGGGGYATIQAAIDASQDGDTIFVMAGTYIEDLQINKAVTIQGANVGISGSGSRGAETVIQGQATVTDSATLDGVKVLNTSSNAVSFTGVSVLGNVNATITNSVFFSTGPNGTNEDRAILLGSGATGNVTVSNNLITGASVAKYSTASWHRGVWSDGGTASLSITGNTFENVRSDVNLDGYNDAVTTVSGNNFNASGTAISIGTPTGSAITGIHDNVFNDVDADINLQNLAAGQSFDLTATNNTGAGAGAAAVITVLGGQGADALGGSTGADQIFGNNGNDSLSGGGGSDYLDGVSGEDSMSGGGGDDFYIVNSLGDSVTEQSGEGVDTVQSNFDYTLGANVDNLILVGPAVSGIGNTLDNVITGNANNNNLIGGDGNDRLDGGAGNDAMIGGTGNDTYVIDSLGDSISDTSGIDTVETSLNSYTLAANLENLKFIGTGAFVGTGNSSDNEITGGAGNDTLDGKKGADHVSAGGGDDSIKVDNIGDTVDGGDGTDSVKSDVSFVLAADVENLTLNGNKAIDGTGNALANKLTGNKAANTLIGNAGNDVIDGKGGGDNLQGGAGDDTFTVYAGDTVSGGDDTDTVKTALATYVLGADLENLTFTGGMVTFTGTGNASANTITGGKGNDIIDGMGGIDVLKGGAGSDTYYVDNTADQVVEASGGGNDTVHSTANVYVLSQQIETLIFDGVGNFTGTGNKSDNTITGGAGNDILDGKEGADLLQGGLGNDTYYFDNAGDVADESGGGGMDLVISSVTASLGLGLENLTLAGSKDINGTGNSLDNILIGNSGKNVLNGGVGHDTLTGNAGNDTFLFSIGQADEDHVTDFTGAGGAAGDVLQFVGYGAGTLTHVSGSHYQVTADAAHGSVVEDFYLDGVTNLDVGPGSNDYLFV